ncbi:hypothetical protein [Kamptonema sp. UHCC 0994]|uniref:hypothetical protein n=1 Tax=Kamptonema sp. UHCC 0994 TaxID=3031329 RepID=UPI0023B908A1|nr:hypothetical protein [Kamptonema sp. UHCC 0994]MDF0554206.1 hypothetical protein [Kamptonema sp. UHCC 0994]
MVEKVQYVTNERGDRVGVLLNLETYQQLVISQTKDAEFLVGLSQGELEALAEIKLGISEQNQLDELLERNADGLLDESEMVRLDNLIEKIDRLNLLKARARYTLQKLGE